MMTVSTIALVICCAVLVLSLILIALIEVGDVPVNVEIGRQALLTLSL